jgi:hypothetical protein
LLLRSTQECHPGAIGFVGCARTCAACDPVSARMTATAATAAAATETTSRPVSGV